MLNEFGKTIRKARIDTGETLTTMAKGLKKNVSFLSSIETGAKKIPMSLVPKIRDYLVSKGAQPSDLERLEDYATMANGQLDIGNMKIDQQEVVVRFARSDLTQSQLDLIKKILEDKD